MGSEFAQIVRLLLLFGAVCLLFGAMAGYLLGPDLVHLTRRLLRRLRR
ncbi:hypothetical protein [Actinomadura sp. 7K507]|nr:hypothetical protein [Actinomadura sp. 7K507]